MTIGERIQMHRKNQGLSQEDLAQKLFVSRQTVSQWETDQTVPTVDNIYRLKEILNVSFDELLSDEKVEKEETEEKPLEEYEYCPDEDEAKATIKFVTNFDIKKNLIVIGALILLGLCFSILEAGEVSLGAILGIILFFGLETLFAAVNVSTMKKKQLENMSCRSQHFRLFDDCLEMTFVSDKGGKSQYIIKKEEISNFFETEKYYVFIAKQIIFSIKKEVLKENSILRNFIYKERVDEDKKSKTVSKVLFALTIISGVLSNAFSTIVSDYYYEFPNIEWWFLAIFLPMPIISAVYAIYLIIKKKDWLKNVIVAVIGMLLLCTAVHNTFTPYDYTYDDLDMMGYWNEITDLNIPVDGEIENVFYEDDDYWSSQGRYSSSTVVYETDVADVFEEQILNDKRWTKELSVEMKEVLPDFGFAAEGNIYYCTYNTSTGEYTESPEESGTYNFLLFAYNVTDSILQVEDYTIEVVLE